MGDTKYRLARAGGAPPAPPERQSASDQSKQNALPPKRDFSKKNPQRAAARRGATDAEVEAE